MDVKAIQEKLDLLWAAIRAQFWRKQDHILESQGVKSRYFPVILHEDGKLHSSLLDYTLIPHGALSGLGANDHPQYALVNGNAYEQTIVGGYGQPFTATSSLRLAATLNACNPGDEVAIYNQHPSVAGAIKGLAVNSSGDVIVPNQLSVGGNETVSGNLTVSGDLVASKFFPFGTTAQRFSVLQHTSSIASSEHKVRIVFDKPSATTQAQSLGLLILMSHRSGSTVYQSASLLLVASRYNNIFVYQNWNIGGAPTVTAETNTNTELRLLYSIASGSMSERWVSVLALGRISNNMSVSASLVA